MPHENTPSSAIPFAAILVMAGSGSRLGAAVPKAYVPLAGKPLWRHAADAISRAAGLVRLVLVVPADRVDATRGEVADLAAPSVVVVAGGARRQDSVGLGLAQVPADAAVVAVHDAARPLVTPELCVEVVRAAARSGAAIAASPVRDTLKRVGADGVVAGTVDRATLWHAQTPQAFRTPLLRTAHDEAARRGLDVTDDAQLVETLGLAPVAVVRSDPWNFKVTEPHDTPAAEALLAGRAARREPVPQTSSKQTANVSRTGGGA